MNDQRNIIIAKGLLLNTEQRILTIDGEAVRISPRNCHIMEVFGRFPDKYRTFEDFNSQLAYYGLPTFNSKVAFGTQISLLRTKLYPWRSRILIHNSRTDGYSLYINERKEEV